MKESSSHTEGIQQSPYFFGLSTFSQIYSASEATPAQGEITVPDSMPEPLGIPADSVNEQQETHTEQPQAMSENPHITPYKDSPSAPKIFAMPRFYPTNGGERQSVALTPDLTAEQQRNALESLRNDPERQHFTERFAEWENRDRIDFTAIDNFAKLLGITDMHSAATYVIDGSHRQEATNLLGMESQLRATGESTESTFGGASLPMADMTLVIRNPTEEARDPYITEEHIFHENVHRCGTRSYVAIPDADPSRADGVQNTRTGHRVSKIVSRKTKAEIVHSTYPYAT